MTDSSDELPIPAALHDAVHRWQTQGKLAQPPIRWSRAAWHRHFPNHREFLDALPDRIDRAEATNHAAHAASPEGAERAFLAAMIWGYGRVGYGPWRTARVLTENPDAAVRLAEVAVAARDGGGLAAFRELAGKPLRYLGVAFGTKYLRFVTAKLSADEVGAPILDAVVRRWFATHTGLRLMIDDWRPSVYEKYVRILGSWSARLGLPVDTAEELIFRSAVSRGQWSESWPDPDESASPEQRAQTALLDLERLFDTADADAAREAREHLDELGRIIRQGWGG